MKNWLCASLASFIASTGIAVAGYPGAGYPQVIQVQAPAEAAPAAPAKVMPEAQPIVLAADGSMGCSTCSDCFAPDQGCGPRLWFGADYLLWWVKDGPLPPLVTTDSSATAGGFPQNGALGTPGVSVVLGGDMDYGTLHGARFGGGVALSGGLGLEASVFFLGRGTFNFDAASSAGGNPSLYTPLFVEGVGEVGVAIASPAFPGIGLPGTVSFTSTTELWGAEINATYGLGQRFQVLAGFRYLDLQEDATLTARLSTPPIGFLGLGALSLTTYDHFSTRNQFYGVSLGAKVGFGGDRLSADVIGKIALGGMNKKVSANGNLALGLPVNGVPLALTAPGGRYVQSTNGGAFEQDDFCAIPELEIRVGYRVNSWLRATIGYNILYVTDVLRPGDQIDRTLSLGSVPIIQAIGGLGFAPGRPIIPFESSDFWAQGINFGLHASW